MHTARARRSRSWAAAALVAVSATACSGQPVVPEDADPRPWDQPVPGAAETTPWTDEGQPTSPFGPGGPRWESPQRLLLAMSNALGAQVTTEAALASQTESGTVVGWIRLTDLAADPVLAADLRLEMRNDGDSWFVARTLSREHCRQALLAGACQEEPPASGSSDARPDRSKSPAAEGGAYLAIGDSITFGIGVSRPQENGYVARVAASLRSMGIDETRTFAVPGETAAGFLGRRLDDVRDAVEELGPRIELVTIGLGANELLRTRRDPACAEDRAGDACQAVVDAALADAGAALDAIVVAVQEALADAGSTAAVLLLAYYNPDPDPLADEAIAGSDGIVACDPSASAGLDDRIACIAEARGTGLVDLHAAFRGRELELTRFADGDVHPNAEGYEVIADAIVAEVPASDR